MPEKRQIEADGKINRPVGEMADAEPRTIRVELGRMRLPVDCAFALDAGSIVELDDRCHEPVSVFVDGRLLARGAAVAVDGRLGIKVTEINRGYAT